MIIYAIIICCAISFILILFRKQELPKNKTYEDDKKELNRLLNQERMIKKIHDAEKKKK